MIDRKKLKQLLSRAKPEASYENQNYAVERTREWTLSWPIAGIDVTVRHTKMKPFDEWC